MKLLRFRVTNFRSVADSGWIELSPVTAMIGVNESGKTNLLLPLWKFNPAREGEIVPVADYPKSMYGTIRAKPEDYSFVQTVFDSSSIAASLAKTTGFDEAVFRELNVTRKYNNKFNYHFTHVNVPRKYDKNTFHTKLTAFLDEITNVTCASKDESLRAKTISKIQELQAYTLKEPYLNSEDFDKIEADINALLPENPGRSNTIIPLIGKMAEEVTAARASISIKSPYDFKETWQTVLDSLPKFIYYSNYGNLDSEIYLPHVVDNLKRTDLGSKEAAKARTLRVLFKFVRLSPEEILELGKEDLATGNPALKPSQEDIEKTSTKKRERSTLLQSAGTLLTAKFKEWWKQGDYRFRFEADGNFFQIWVSDDRRPDEVELEGRSTGLQWFLSFYLVFLVESENEHDNSILLLDEPGISLHPLAQRDLSVFFENLASQNQLIYTTHSPFLVDADHLDRVRKVYVDENGKTKATEDLRQGASEPSSGASYAVNSALNLSVAESLLLGCCPIIVEGPSDQHYLTAIKSLLIGGKEISPGRELVFPPSGGTKTIRSIASILLGRDERLPKVLLDADTMGAKMKTELSTSLYAEQKEDLLSASDFCSIEKGEIEDLFPAEFIATIVDKVFRGADEDFADVLKLGEPIVDQIEAWAKKNRISLEKGWKVILAKRVKQQALTKGLRAFDAETVANWKRLFELFSA